jgi:hypothetical protein
MTTLSTSIFIYRHGSLQYLFFPFPSILDIAQARQSGPNAELGKDVDIEENPGSNNGEDKDQFDH